MQHEHQRRRARERDDHGPIQIEKIAIGQLDPLAPEAAAGRAREPRPERLQVRAGRPPGGNERLHGIEDSRLASMELSDHLPTIHREAARSMGDALMLIEWSHRT